MYAGSDFVALEIRQGLVNTEAAVSVPQGASWQGAPARRNYGLLRRAMGACSPWGLLGVKKIMIGIAAHLRLSGLALPACQN